MRVLCLVKLVDLMEISNTRASVDNFYVNVDLFTKRVVDDGVSLTRLNDKAEQTINYNTPLLDDPSKYSVALEKAIIPMGAVPLYKRSTRNLLMRLENAGSYVTYGYDVGDEDVYFVHTILDKINIDIQDYYINIGANANNSPFFLFNSVTGLFEYHIANELEYQRCTIHVSGDLYDMLNGFNFEKSKYKGFYTFKPITQNFMRAPKDTYGHMVYSQEFSSIGNWSDVDTILVTTNLPVVPEATGSFSLDAQGGSSMNILTDLTINPGSVMGSRGDVTLAPNYRR
jgi:hypothetical protein